MGNDASSTPQWIFTFFLSALLLAAAAVIAALLFGGRGGHLVHGPGVEDVTVNLNGTPVREHCTTCHVQGGLPGVENEGVVGDRHPDISPHDWRTLGCTGCHLGEGMALDTEISHGLPGLGARKVLTGREVQARCYACHEPAPLEGAEKAWRGYELFRASACDSCHRVDAAGQGGAYGPDLSTIGSTLGLERLQEAIRDPKAEPPNSIMPRFPLSRSQAREIAWFLKSRVRDPAYATPMELQAGREALPPVEPPVPESLPAEGRLLATAQCLACHRFGEEDGGIAPDLTWIGAMQDREYLEEFLIDPARLIPGAIMPRTVGSESDRKDLVDFLDARARGPVRHEKHAGGREGNVPKAHYMMLCQRCHAANGDGRGRIQPNLAQFPRAFAGNADFFRRADDGRLVRSVDRGIPGTSMPPYGRLLSREEIDGVMDLVFAAFVGIPREEKGDQPPLPEIPSVLFGPGRAEELYREICLRCHGSHGTGRGPEAPEHLPRPRNLTNVPYFSSLEDGRIARAVADGVPGTAMPSFRSRLTPAELWGLVDQVRRFSEGSRP